MKYTRTAEHQRKITEARRGKELKPAIERFMSHVKVTPGGCWKWIGATKPGGYGIFVIKKYGIQKTYNAHRWSYEYHKGKIPEGLTIDHLCRVRNCVNPDHLEAVTMRENLMRGNGYTAKNARKTHCPRGHLLVPVPESRATKNRTTRRHCPKCDILKALEWRKANPDRYLEIEKRRSLRRNVKARTESGTEQNDTPSARV